MVENKQFLRFSSAASMLPKEETLEASTKKNNLVIGIPREQSTNENRIGLVPEAVKPLVDNGHRVLVETSAGLKADFSDYEYAEAGAEITNERESVFAADIVLKIAPPLPGEVEMLQKNRTIMSTLQAPSRTKDFFVNLMAQKVIAIAFENIQDKTGTMPLKRSMSEIIGNASIMIAAEYLCHPEYGKGVMLGGFPGIAPTEVVIIGAGTVTEYAARTALGMGALVKVFDNSMYKLRSLQTHLGNRIFTSVLQSRLLENALVTADVVIAAKHAGDGPVAFMIDGDLVKKMKAGSVIIDVSIDQGGCFETSRATSHKSPVYKMYDVTHYCVPNIASKVPRTASYSLSNFFGPILQQIGEMGGVENLLRMDRGLGKGVYTFNGKITNHQISKIHNLAFQHLDLLMAAYF
jgi:alanine dehydrogenase